ncbi:MAG: hypothetical protein GXY83_36635 [Rhodopirellula sp.]|nr:hypothetical protein [Rhodopirellula sp.]
MRIVRSPRDGNPLLVRVLASVGIMRDEGEGVPRIFEEMQESLLRQPEFGIEAAQVAVVLRNQPIFSGASAEWHGIVSQLPINVAQKRVLLAHPDGFSNEDYRTLNAVDRDDAYKQIQEMVAMGVLQPPPSAGRGAVYRPAPGLLQSRGWLEKRIPVLQTFFTTHDRLTNTDYRELFNVTRFAAIRDLRRLTEEGFLVLEGERRGAFYRSGPPLKAG